MKALSLNPLYSKQTEPYRVKLGIQEIPKKQSVAVRFVNRGLDKKLFEELQKTILFDVNNNGVSSVSSKGHSSDYKVNIFFDPTNVKAEFSCVKKGVNKYVEMHLFNHLAPDRQSCHKLVDSITEALFDKKGIAATKILFTRSIGNSTEVFECDYDGENARQVTFHNSYVVTPCYIPNGGKKAESFLYVSYRSGQSKIHRVFLGTGKDKPLFQLSGSQFMPAVSEATGRIAFISDAASNPDLFMQNFSHSFGLQGLPRQIFTIPEKTQASPSFSPDGSKLAFTSDIKGTPQVYILQTIETQKDPSVLTSRHRECSAPAWSPDGTMIAYTAKTEGLRQIWVHHLQTKEDKQLTKGAGNKENPSWASNNLSLVYNTSDYNSSELFLVHLHDSKIVQISKGGGDKRFPSWGT